MSLSLSLPPAFRHRAFALFWSGRMVVTFAIQIVSVAVGWQIYDLTHDPWDLGLVGLVQFVPSALLVLWTGAAADRFDRRMIMMACSVVEMIAVAVLLLLVLDGIGLLWPIYAALAVIGIARAFFAPASQALLPNLVPREDFASAIALSASAWQLSAIVGPVTGGLLYGISPLVAYGSALVLLVLGILMFAWILVPPRVARIREAGWDSLIAGLRFIFAEKVVLGAITLDLFAVLLGGATALMPAVARDVLDLGPWGLGLLRAAPGVGALVVAGYLAWRPLRDHVGALLFVYVALFGVATAAFGLSDIPWLSIVLLAAIGGTDMVSVSVRETVLQLWTPDAMRGRVTAANMVFVGASNEIGEFRAGSMGSVIGVVPAIVLGGVGTVIVAGIWAWLFPDLRKIRRFEQRH